MANIVVCSECNTKNEYNIPKDTQICRCTTCGLLQYTGVKTQSDKDEQSCRASGKSQDSERSLNSNVLKSNNSEETLDPSLSNSIVEEKKIQNNKKMVLNELREKWKKKKQKYIYEIDDVLDEILDNFSDCSSSNSLFLEN
ncbi:uncharacterized protein cubi_03343 [Cryptosporidium ubiquitum]|uniref:Uncharacterized protein n=1 Tax=Cryptosporidium ubiquitum TaxID=857276 RepID=A0A1J4MF34_9CRYT|nr:uncharacterized protein cubi_03343 [Cryptosporidium ubiquitum]OII72607.1 hypothetical protein cubi_03343 [Cryptosporidium ubiquitum]